MENHFALNAARQAQYRALLTRQSEVAGMRVHFDFTRLYPETDAVDTLIAHADELKRDIDSFRPLDSDQMRNLEQYFDHRYTYESNRIEGNTLTFQETALVLEKGITIAGKSLREHLEVTGHAQAFDYVKEIAQGNLEFSEGVLKRIHQLVLGAVDRRNAGTYRTVDVAITGSAYQPPAPYHLVSEMEAFFTFFTSIKQTLHPVLLSAAAHERLVKIYPFIDGNGRTARLLMNLILLQHGYPIANIAADTRNVYYDALEHAHLYGEMDAFYRLVAREVKRSAIWYLERISTTDDARKGIAFFERIAPFLDG